MPIIVTLAILSFIPIIQFVAIPMLITMIISTIYELYKYKKNPESCNKEFADYYKQNIEK